MSVVALLSATLTLALLMASPAIAQNSGSGSAAGDGRETLIDEEGEDKGTAERPFCQEVRFSEYVIDFDGVFSAVDPQEQAIYEGPAEMTITTEETYYISPEGTYGGFDETGCDVTTFGPAGAIDVEVEVTDPGTDPDEGIECDGTGSYFRVANAFTVVWTGECVVDGNVIPFDGKASTGDMTTHEVEAEFVPCFEGQTPPGCTESTLQGALWTYEGAGT